MDNQIELILLPGESFTKVELKTRLQVMNINDNFNVQNKKYLVNAYDEAIKVDENILKLKKYLINDTQEAKYNKRSNKNTTVWIVQVDNNNCNKVQSRLFKEQRYIMAQGYTFSLFSRQRNKIGEQNNNNNNSVGNNNYYLSKSNRLNDTIPIDVKANSNKDVFRSDHNIGINNYSENQNAGPLIEDNDSLNQAESNNLQQSNFSFFRNLILSFFPWYVSNQILKLLNKVLPNRTLYFLNQHYFFTLCLMETIISNFFYLILF